MIYIICNDEKAIMLKVFIMHHTFSVSIRNVERCIFEAYDFTTSATQ